MSSFQIMWTVAGAMIGIQSLGAFILCLSAFSGRKVTIPVWWALSWVLIGSLVGYTFVR